VEGLVRKGYSVTALVQYNSRGSWGWLEHLKNGTPKNLKVLLGDVRDTEFMSIHIHNHDVVYHLASLIAIPYSYYAPRSYVETNIIGSLNVAQASLKAGVKRVVHTSTSEVYGTAQIVPITEEHPLVGQSPYSASKIGADKMMESYFTSFDLPVVVLRPFNTYGPRQSFRAVIPTVIAQILQKNPTIELGAVKPTRDFNFVQDTVEAFITVAETPNDALLGQTFNAATEKEISIGDMVRLVSEILNHQVEIKSSEERLRPQKSEVDRLVGSSSKLQRLTTWKPRYTLRQGLDETIQWLKTQDLSSTFEL
jgi:UDP-glucose 4-epimerase